MSTQIKNTLFRFVTMRAPELINDDEIKNNFVQLAEEQEYYSSHFLSGILQNATAPRKEFLQNLASEFAGSSLNSKKDISNIAGESFLKFAAWLTANRNSLTEEKLAPNIPSSLKPLNLDTRIKIWDNVFYQIISPKSGYIRESLLSLLVADFFISNKNLPFEQLKEIAKARVIIPKLLLEDDNKINPPAKKGATRTIPVNSKALDKELDLFVANQNILEHQEVIKELDAIKESYNKSIQAGRENAYKKYEADVAKMYDGAQTVEIKYIDKETGIEKTLVEYVGLKIPSFEFTPESDTDFALGLGNISEQAARIITSLPTAGAGPSLSQAIAVLEDGIAQESQTLISQAPANQAIANNGGILTPINTNTATLGNVFSLVGQNPSGIAPLTLLFNNAPQGADVIGADYSVTFDNRTTAQSTTFNDTWVNGKLQVALFTENLNFATAKSFTITGELLLSNSTAMEINGNATVTRVRSLNTLTTIKASGNGKFEMIAILDDNDPDQPEAPVTLEPIPTYGFRRLGITDYRKVEQEVCCYVPGEVSHIENIMAREFKEKTTRRSRKTEDTTTTSKEQETEKLTDTSTTERHEMNQEVASVMAQDNHVGVQAGVHWGGPSGFGGQVNADYAHNTSSETSNSQAVMHAKEITERALDRVVQKVKEERTTKIIEEFSEEDTHGFDNRKGDNHISGVYRWVDKVYKNKVVNYGKRLMYEFMIPEPSSFHNEVTSGKKDAFTEILVMPADPRTVSGSLALKDSSVVAQNIYKHWAAIYNAEIEAYPEEEITAGESFNILGHPNGSKLADTESNAGNGKIKIPEGYHAYYATGVFNASGDNNLQGNILSLSIGNAANKHTGRFYNWTLSLNGPIQNYETEVPVSYTLGNHVAGDITASVKCRLTEKAKQQWRLKAFNAIIEAYEAKLAEFEAKLNEAKATGDTKAKTNPGFYRQVENMILRKNCIAYMLGHDNMGKNMLLGSNVKELRVNNNAQLDAYASQVKFLEQAFEWDLMSYYFYPFYWANKDKWASLYNPDEMNDPIFRAFLQSGMARVILTVRPGFEETVNWFIATGQVWNGGQVPTIDDPLFVSIIKELRETEGEVEETWETRVPTSLTIIQAGSMGLNVASALPCSSDCDGNIMFDSDGQPMLDAEGNPIKSFVKTDVLIGEGAAEEEQQKMASSIQKMQTRMIENVDIENGYLKLTTDSNPRQIVAQISVEALKREMGL